MAVLYRKYRPQTFAEVLNQRPIIQTLKNQVLSGKLAHAYLFTGSRGVGKTSVARILAKAVNCVSEAGSRNNGDTCGKCEVCKQIEQGLFLDLVEIDAASNTGVDNIRELIEHVKFSPSAGKYKVFIIDEVHMLSKGAFNALLKTLEEPPKHAIFILATTEINKVPATIISRTQRFDFKALSAADILEHLQKVCLEEKVKLSREVLELVAQNAEGSVRDSLSLLDKVMTLGETASLEDAQQFLGITDIKTCENLLELVALGKAAEIPSFYNGLSEKGLDYSIFNRDFLEFLRKVLVNKVTSGAADFGLANEHKEKISQLAAQFSAADLVFVIRLFLKSYKDLSSSPAPQIPLLVAGVEAALRKSGSANQQISGSVNQLISKPENQKLATKQPEDAKLEIPKSEPPVVESKTTEQQAEIAVEEIINEQSVMHMAEAENLWPKIIAKIKQVNGPLASMLKNCQPISVEGPRIFVKVKFAFDKQNLESAKNADLLRKTISELSGKKMAVVGQVIKQEAAEAGNPAEILGQALKVFGGELVE